MQFWAVGWLPHELEARSHAAGRANACRSVSELLAAPEVAALLAEGAAAAGCHGSSSSNSSDSGSSSDNSSSGAGAAPQRRKLVLVFGREVEGLLDHEVDACDYTLSIPIGRLQGGRLHLAVPWKGQWSTPSNVWL